MRTPATFAILAVVLSACGGEPPVSDTGYVGTWSRGNERQQSHVYIDRHEDGYRFRISVRSDDGLHVVECDGAGVCEERVRGEKTLEYRFRTRTEPASGRLIVEYDVESLRNGRVYHYVDVLTVEDGGLRLRAATIERDGVRFEEKGGGPTRLFRKTSDRVDDAPRPDPPS
jgi:hypothetical protein